MTASDSLSLLETPHVLDALADISQDRGHPLLQEDVCLWVGGRLWNRSRNAPNDCRLFLSWNPLTYGLPVGTGQFGESPVQRRV